MRYRIEAFDPGRHDSKHFRCGSAGQDNFLRRTARRQQREGYTRLFLATTPSESAEPRVVLGFYAINAHAIGTADLPPLKIIQTSPSSGQAATRFCSALFLLPATQEQH